ncbi:HlyD family secretion protein [Pseudoxanthomonas spadix]|uniref:HlyD family secretion protein n=1 Tax=Pseudoxanthomonas spadix TaxID=415229 RepID=UPI000F00F744|nr:HlyD family efflux transporter periplasmic adaptor subunit [Pseudoxanthomonas spadix]MBP3975826.1 HlyD family efflux transporter periplasmic adaptor subunit [Pseudoxanthomonas spadix]RMW93110.1 HlyD family efflux transporter periplasmic adaptor subunit [Pseudoxanthomonas spadix]
MSQPLFRQEVLEAQRGSWLGAVLLAQPLKLWVLTVFAAVAATVVVLFFVLGTYTHRSTVAGQLVPTTGLAVVAAPASGVVSSVPVIEGNQVKAGERLAIVVVPRATPLGGDTQVELGKRLEQRQAGIEGAGKAQQAQLLAQEAGLRAQLLTAQNELSQIKHQVSTRQNQVKIANETLDRLTSLQDDKYVSLLQISQQKTSMLEYTSQVQTLQQQAAAARRNIAQLQQSLAELPSQRIAAEANLQRDLGQISQERVETEVQGTLAVSAPVSGVITTQMIKPGQAVQTGNTLMSILPGNGILEADLLVPSRAIGFIQPGDKVQLRYQAYPYQKFGHQEGRVSKISRSALSSGELGALIGKADQGEPYYRVTVTLAKQDVIAYGKSEKLKPGMLLDADIMGEKRRLIEWIFEPIYALKYKG